MKKEKKKLKPFKKTGTIWLHNILTVKTMPRSKIYGALFLSY